MRNAIAGGRIENANNQLASGRIENANNGARNNAIRNRTNRASQSHSVPLQCIDEQWTSNDLLMIVERMHVLTYECISQQ